MEEERRGCMGGRIRPPGKLKVGVGLALSQEKEVLDIQGRYPVVFSKKPGLTHMVTHKIVMKEPKVVRLLPRKWLKHWEEPLI